MKLKRFNQPEDYTCGVCALMSVLHVFGCSAEYSKVKAALGPRPLWGTPVWTMVAALHRLGYHVDAYEKARQGAVGLALSYDMDHWIAYRWARGRVWVADSNEQGLVPMSEFEFICNYPTGYIVKQGRSTQSVTQAVLMFDWLKFLKQIM